MVCDRLELMMPRLSYFIIKHLIHAFPNVLSFLQHLKIYNAHVSPFPLWYFWSAGAITLWHVLTPLGSWWSLQRRPAGYLWFHTARRLYYNCRQVPSWTGSLATYSMFSSPSFPNPPGHAWQWDYEISQYSNAWAKQQG